MSYKGRDRRGGKDRRTREDRRSGVRDRRVGQDPAWLDEKDRRKGPSDRRRKGDRREGTDRRGRS